MSTSTATIVVGVVPTMSDTLLYTAAEFAKRFNAELLCASVDASRYAIDAMADGTIVAVSINPDIVDDVPEVFDPVLQAEIAATLDPTGVTWSTRALAGGPYQELSRLAEDTDAAMIIVGTREPGFLGGFREFLNGSVAAQLAHRQHRPVVVVPLRPVDNDGALPWHSQDN